MADPLVINTGPLIAFERIGALEFVGRLPYDFICPSEVRLELDQGEISGHARIAEKRLSSNWRTRSKRTSLQSTNGKGAARRLLRVCA